MAKNEVLEECEIQFFMPSAKTKKSKKRMLTRMLIPEVQSDGTEKIVAVVLEQQTNPLTSLSFDDFTLNNLIKSGISPKSLAIQCDERFGLDSEIEAFNQQLVANSDKLFNLENN